MSSLSVTTSLPSLASLSVQTSTGKTETLVSRNCTQTPTCPTSKLMVDALPLPAQRVTADFVPVSSIKNAAMSAFAGLFTGFALTTAYTAICFDSVSWEKGSIEFKSEDMFKCLGPKLPVATLLGAMTAATAITAISTVAYNRYNSYTKG